MPNISDTKSNTVPSPDAAATRVDLSPLNEADFSITDPSGNERDVLQNFGYCKAEEFQGPWQAAQRKASTPRSHAGVPKVQEVPINDTDLHGR
jgi:hypothetical protein